MLERKSCPRLRGGSDGDGRQLSEEVESMEEHNH